MTRNEKFRRRLGRQINVRHDHDVGRCVGFDIIMQQIFTRLCCERTPLTKRSSCSICRACNSKTRRCPRLIAVLPGNHVRDTVNGRPCRLQHADAPINSIRQLSMMTWRNTILEKNPTQGRVAAIKRGFHPLLQLTWDTDARVLRANFETHANFVLRSHLVRSQDR